MKHNWEYKQFTDIATSITPRIKVDKSDYLLEGPVPIISQEESYISGYWDNLDDITPHNGPVIIFGDHSRVLKYVDCDFVVGADGVKIISPKDCICAKFLFHFLKWYNIPSLGYSRHFKLIKDATFPVPSIETQMQIVAELDKINETIADCRELLRNLDALAQSLFYDTFGNPITNPKGWEVKKLSDECLDVVDGDHSAPPKTDKGVPFITISNIDKTRNSIDFSDTFFVPQSYYDGLKDNRKARNGDVLYTVTGSYGVTVLIENLPKFCFQRHIGLIRPKATLNSVFLSYWGRSASIKAYADTVATGIAQKTVSLKSLRDFPIILPPLSLQEQFAARIEQIEAQKKAVEQTIAELQTLLDSRMDYWFN